MKKLNKNKRRKSINIRLDDYNHKLLNEIKAISGFRTWEEFILHYMNNGRGFKKVLVDEEGQSLKALNHLIRYGNNLNQLARKANENNLLDEDDIKEIKTFLKEGIKARNYFLKHVKPFNRSK
ncbi:plasmid mobilization relaxosome protein MobC [Marinomonas pollencensis]|uniref:Mobilization protein MobC n=1 Tax=Marinomonas pollencensis TaxID=491954 RepID=A0A3E0DRA5_9GAMM|nr:plasmid mobilization relaxosome protein MobC [Marinomonas pollencensis]REG84401.1 mobilization protein MobC [Marinomonas pollencensis]